MNAGILILFCFLCGYYAYAFAAIFFAVSLSLMIPKGFYDNHGDLVFVLSSVLWMPTILFVLAVHSVYRFSRRPKNDVAKPTSS